MCRVSRRSRLIYGVSMPLSALYSCRLSLSWSGEAKVVSHLGLCLGEGAPVHDAGLICRVHIVLGCGPQQMPQLHSCGSSHYIW